MSLVHCDEHGIYLGLDECPGCAEECLLRAFTKAALEERRAFHAVEEAKSACEAGNLGWEHRHAETAYEVAWQALVKSRSPRAGERGGS